MGLDKRTLEEIVLSIVNTRPDEIGCAGCYAELDRFAEMYLAGRSPAEALPLVQAHLERCKDCREEYQALLDALKGMS